MTTSLSLEKRLYYSRNPYHYFNDVDGARDRYRNFLEKRYESSRVGYHYLHPSQEIFDTFLKKDKKVYRRTVRSHSPQGKSYKISGVSVLR